MIEWNITALNGTEEQDRMKFLKNLLILMVLLMGMLIAVEVKIYKEHSSELQLQSQPVKTEEETVPESDTDYDSETAAVLPAVCKLEVPELLQEPELPTGCESVALTMVLMKEGYELEKTTIADEYLIYSENSDFSEGYVGNPESYEGAGCFPPAIVKTANAFLKEHKSSLRAKEVSCLQLEELFPYIAKGIPVIVWTTMYMVEPELSDEGFEQEGIDYRWYPNEHCVVMSGYDFESETVTIHDPLEGVVERDLKAFEDVFDKIGQFAVVLI